MGHATWEYDGQKLQHLAQAGCLCDVGKGIFKHDSSPATMQAFTTLAAADWVIDWDGLN